MIKIKKSQVSIEYLIIIGFVTFTIIGILAIAFFYSGAIKDKIKTVHIGNYANKIVSTSESVFYAGKPSKATITTYLPDGIKSIEISGNELVITFQTSSGTNKITYLSNVPLSQGAGALSTTQGLKKIEITAQSDWAEISQI